MTSDNRVDIPFLSRLEFISQTSIVDRVCSCHSRLCGTVQFRDEFQLSTRRLGAQETLKEILEQLQTVSSVNQIKITTMTTRRSLSLSSIHSTTTATVQFDVNYIIIICMHHINCILQVNKFSISSPFLSIHSFINSITSFLFNRFHFCLNCVKLFSALFCQSTRNCSHHPSLLQISFQSNHQTIKPAKCRGIIY